MTSWIRVFNACMNLDHAIRIEITQVSDNCQILTIVFTNPAENLRLTWDQNDSTSYNSYKEIFSQVKEFLEQR